MAFHNWRSLFASSAPKKLSVRRRPPGRFRPKFESLEDRRMLSATMWVDANLADLKAHPTDFSTISAAVAAAHPGDTIKVGPGQYNESVSVNKSLTIIGGQARLAGESGASVVTPPNSAAGFSLGANGVTVQNFTVAPTASVGISTNPAYSGYKIQNNVFSGQYEGLDLETSTSSAAQTSTVSGNQFGGNSTWSILSGGSRNVVISQNTFAGQASASGVISLDYATGAQILSNQLTNTTGMELQNITNSTIDGNVLTNSRGDILLLGNVTKTAITNNSLALNGAAMINSPVGINFDASGGANNQINHNTIVGFGEGIAVTGVSSTVVSNNTVTGSFTNGVLLSSLSNATVSGNTLNNNGNDGVYLVNSNNVTISGNTLDNNVGSGVYLRNSSSNTVSANISNGNQHYGIHLVTSGSNMVSGNTFDNNSVAGILVDADSTGNTFSRNIAVGNGQWDLEDNSIGALTAGTANTWIKNTANKRGPAGLG